MLVTHFVGIECLAPRGTMVLFGSASGPAPPLEMHQLANGAKFVTFASVFFYVFDPKEMQQRSTDVFKWLCEGKLNFGQVTVMPLTDARKAHDMLTGRKTIGKVLLSCKP